MTGRYALAVDGNELLGFFDARLSGTQTSSATYNIAPGKTAPILVQSIDQTRWLTLGIWGWADVSERYFNALADTVLQRPSFLPSLLKRRCIIPATGFYFWTGKGGAQKPHYCCMKDRSAFAIAGIWTTNDLAAAEEKSRDGDESASNDIDEATDDLAIAPEYEDVAPALFPDTFYGAQSELPLSPTDTLTFSEPGIAVEEEYDSLGLPGIVQSTVPEETDFLPPSADSHGARFLMLTRFAKPLTPDAADRLPLILHFNHVGDWLRNGHRALDALIRASVRAGELECYRVRTLVNDPAYSSPRCIEPFKTGRTAAKRRSPAKRRGSTRKGLIAKQLSEARTPMLLGELRWKVHRQEAEAGPNPPSNALTRSYCNSFARTIRDHCPELALTHLLRPECQPVGILVQDALYRLNDRDRIDRILSDGSYTAYCKYERRGRRRTVDVVFAKDWTRRGSLDGHTRYPITNPIVLVSLNEWPASDLAKLAETRFEIVRVTGAGSLRSGPDKRHYTKKIGVLDASNPRWRKRKFPRRRLTILDGQEPVEEAFELRIPRVVD